MKSKGHEFAFHSKAQELYRAKTDPTRSIFTTRGKTQVFFPLILGREL